MSNKLNKQRVAFGGKRANVAKSNLVRDDKTKLYAEMLSMADEIATLKRVLNSRHKQIDALKRANAQVDQREHQYRSQIDAMKRELLIANNQIRRYEQPK